MRTRLVLLFAALTVFTATTFALSLREVSPVRVGKDNQSVYGVSVEIARVIGAEEQYWGIPPGDENGWTYRVKITVPKNVEGGILRKVDVWVDTVGAKKVQLSTSIALEDEGSCSSGSLFMNAATIQIAHVSVDYGSMDFFYSIDLRSYFPEPAEKDGAGQRPDGAPVESPPSKPGPRAGVGD